MLKYKTRLILSYDNKNAELNKCVLSFTLKTLSDLAHLTSNGKVFHSPGAAQVPLQHLRALLSCSTKIDLFMGAPSGRQNRGALLVPLTEINVKTALTEQQDSS